MRAPIAPPATGQVVEFTVTGKTITDLHIAAHGALAGLVPDHRYRISDLRISPVVQTFSGSIDLWEAAVSATVPPIVPAPEASA